MFNSAAQRRLVSFSDMRNGERMDKERSIQELETTEGQSGPFFIYMYKNYPYHNTFKIGI